MRWQGNPELVRYRTKLVRHSLYLARELGQNLEEEDVPKEELARIDELHRASGQMICSLCDLEYRVHPDYPYAIGWGERPFLLETCNGDLIKT